MGFNLFKEVGKAFGKGPLGYLDAGLGLYGALDAQRRQRNAAREREALLQRLSAQYDQQLGDLRSNNTRSLYGATGLAGDALQSLGRRLGDAMASAGVYNSSATAGTLAQANMGQQTRLADLARQMHAQELAQNYANQQHLTNLRMGYADRDYYDARLPTPLMQGLSSVVGGMRDNVAKHDAEQEAKKREAERMLEYLASIFGSVFGRTLPFSGP